MSIDRLRAHWGFSKTPFTKELAPSMLFGSSSHQQAVARISWVVQERALGVVCGEVGAGKTVAARAATAGLDPSRHTLIYLPNPVIGARGIHAEIVRALGDTPRFHTAPLIAQAQEMLETEEAERGRRVVLVLDESHLLTSEQLEQLRMLTNSQMDSRATFACVLLGQPTLRRRLRQATFAALDQRIALRYSIDGMDLKETGDYLAHHLKLAGRSDTLFSDDAIGLIHEFSRGLPRQVNNLATQALIAAYVTNSSICDEKAARAALAEALRMTTTPSRPVMELPAPGRVAGTAGPGRLSRTGRRDRRAARAEHRSGPSRDPHPAAGRVRRDDRPQLLLPGRSDQPPPQRVRAPRRRHRESEKGQLVRSRRATADRRAPQLPLARHDRPVQRRGADLGRPRPPRPRPRRARQTAARRRTRVRVRPESHVPRDLDAVPDTQVRVGRPAARAAHEDRAGDRHQRAHRDHRSHHPDRARPAHHHRRARQRIPEPVPDLRVPARPTAPRRRQPRTAERHRPCSSTSPRSCSTPTPAARSRSPTTPESCGGTPTRS